MASKKLNFLVGAMALLTFSAATAQTGSVNVYRGSGYDVLDTALIPTSRMDQQRDFLNRNYDYPAKPRNQWELGVSVGPLNVSGDVRSKAFYNRPIKGQALTGSNAWSVSLRKAWGYVISTRLQYMQGAAHGYNWQSGTNHILQGANPYWQSYKNASAFYAYRSQIREIDLQLIASLNNIKFHRARNKMSVHGLFGIGGLLYKTKNDMKDANNANYDFTPAFKAYADAQANTGLWTNGYKSVRKDIENILTDNIFDGTFETDAERHDNRWFNSKGYTFRPVANVGMGVQFRLGKRFSLGIEDKVTFTNDDLIDGYRWQEVNVTSSGQYSQSDMTRDFDNINYLAVTLGVNLGGKSVAPLWWLNPMDFAYNELTNPRRLRTEASENCATKDTDNDGVSDCFDKCNDTPLGVAVDTKGCCLDTDADGVCDYKDKQLITPTECQPVDADGIGKCPCPDCGMKNPEGPRCGGMSDQNISFAPGSTKLSGSGMSTLNSLAAQLKANPSCNVIIAGNGEGKLEQQRSWMRANAVLNYMNSQGIDRDRFIFQFGQSGPGNSVDLKVAPQGMMGGSIPPPPHPNLK